MWTTFIGFMGSGKSTAARHLRRATGRVALDLDDEIERTSGATLAELSRREGEAGLRGLELETLTRLSAAPSLILAAGGGVVESGEAVGLLRERGAVFWLDAPWEVLRARLEVGPTGAGARSLIQLLGWEGLRSLHARRLPLYAAAADFRLRTDRMPPRDVAQTALLRGLIWRRRLSRRRGALSAA
ncbi:MAG: shikimate kinase [Candidatus Krumholzibacteriia bacterium]